MEPDNSWCKKTIPYPSSDPRTQYTRTKLESNVSNQNSNLNQSRITSN